MALNASRAQKDESSFCCSGSPLLSVLPDVPAAVVLLLFDIPGLPLSVTVFVADDVFSLLDALNWLVVLVSGDAALLVPTLPLSPLPDAGAAISVGAAVPMLSLPVVAAVVALSLPDVPVVSLLATVLVAEDVFSLLNALTWLVAPVSDDTAFVDKLSLSPLPDTGAAMALGAELAMLPLPVLATVVALLLLDVPALPLSVTVLVAEDVFSLLDVLT
jgi:hypothetical protein